MRGFSFTLVYKIYFFKVNVTHAPQLFLVALNVIQKTIALNAILVSF